MNSVPLSDNIDFMGPYLRIISFISDLATVLASLFGIGIIWFNLKNEICMYYGNVQLCNLSNERKWNKQYFIICYSIVTTNFVRSQIATKMYVFPFWERNNGPTVSITTFSKGLAGVGVIQRGSFVPFFGLLSLHWLQFLTKIATSFRRKSCHARHIITKKRSVYRLVYSERLFIKYISGMNMRTLW